MAIYFDKHYIKKVSFEIFLYILSLIRTNFLGCPTIDDEAINMEEPQPFLNRETEDSKRSILVYVFETIFHIITKDRISKFLQKKIESFTVLGGNWYYKL